LNTPTLFSRGILAVCILAHPLVATLTAGQTDARSSAQQLAGRLVDEVVSKSFGTSRADWRSVAPAATWKEYAGSGGYPVYEVTGYRWPTGRWCAIADDDDGLVRRQAVFYALRDVEPLDCRLEQVTYSIHFPVGQYGRSSELYGELYSAFSRSLGGGSPQGPQSDAVTAEAARRESIATRTAFVRWSTESFSVELFSSQGGDVGFVARHRFTNRVSELGRPVLQSADTIFSQALRNQVGRVFPAIAELMTFRLHSIKAERVRPAIRTLLHTLESATVPSERAWLALAAEELLVQMYFEPDQASEEPPQLADLSSYNLVFEFDAHGDSWQYARGLSAAVRTRYPETDWAQLASARLITGSFEVVDCYDNYADVIREGTAWLEREPSTRFRLMLTEAVAQAYETWWSLSKAPEHDDFAFDSREAATPGAPRARTEAIAWYGRLRRELPAGLPTQGIDETLMRLQLDVDSGQRRFHCAIP
jgi:hypothetical protein